MRLKLKLAVIVATVALCVGLLPGNSLAAAGIVYLSPSGASVFKGNSVTVALRINPGTSVDSVQATVGYSTSRLQFVSLAVGGTFTACAQDSGGGGAVVFACAKLGGSTSSDSLIADITFKALTGSGSATLSVSGANAAKNGSYTNPSSSGATISFKSSASSSPTKAPASSGSSNTPSSTQVPTSSTKKSTTPPPHVTVPQKVTVSAEASKIQITSASVVATASAPVQLYAQYGTDKSNLGLATPLSKAGKSAAVELNQLAPDTVYYYQVAAKDSSGNIVGKSSVDSLTTKGYTVSVTVLDSHYHPIVGKVVTLHSNPVPATTNSKGVATFTNVAPGLHHVEYAVGSHNYTQAVYVTDNVVTKNGTQTSAPQTAAVVLNGYAQPALGASRFTALILLVVLALVGVVLVVSKTTGRWVSVVKQHLTTTFVNKPPNTKTPHPA